MVDVIRRLASILKVVDKLRPTFRRPIVHLPFGNPRVLVLGVYLADRQNTTSHLIQTLSAAAHCTVTQRWIALNGPAATSEVRAATVRYVNSRVPKFTLVNELVEPKDITAHDYIIVCDDDIMLPPDFVDRFIGWQQHCGFALAQPARTWNSYIDHKFVRRDLFTKARETQFVEIGPLFSMNQEMARLLLPFDDLSAMGWGYDLVWPVKARSQGLRLGIIDDAAVEHSIRARGAAYATGPEMAAMGLYLAVNEHLRAADAFTVLRRYH